MRKFYIIILLLIGLGTPWSSFAQPRTLRIQLSFGQDSVALGEILELRMTVQHLKGTEVFFPTRRRDFLPFEWIESERLPTQTSGDLETDAMIFRIRTFNLAARQSITLPYGYRSATDTIRSTVTSSPLVLIQQIQELDDSLSYQIDPKLEEVVGAKPSSEWLWWLGGILLISSLLGWLLRSPALKLLKRRQLRQEWNQLQRKLQALLEEKDQAQVFDELSHIWRHWMDSTEEWGLLSLTTTELSQKLPSLSHLTEAERHSLLEASRATDKVIYAGRNLKKAEIKRIIEDIIPVLHQEYLRRDQAILRNTEKV